MRMGHGPATKFVCARTHSLARVLEHRICKSHVERGGPLYHLSKEAHGVHFSKEAHGVNLKKLHIILLLLQKSCAMLATFTPGRICSAG